MDSLALILILPLLGALILFLSPKNYAVLSGLHVLFSAATSVALLNNVLKVLSGGTFYSFDKFLFLDRLCFLGAYRCNWIYSKFLLYPLYEMGT